MIRFDPNNYEFNKSSDIGVYIIHGVSNTTYEVKELAEFLVKNNEMSFRRAYEITASIVNLAEKKKKKIK